MSTQPTAIIPQARCAVKIRLAGSADLPFIDQLQKLHTHMVGFFPRKQMEGYLALGAVQIAVDEAGKALGYIVSRDQYSGRDDVGMIYQINVTASKHRHLIGAMLVKAAFEKAAYGCKLFSCWCAQDIAANWFWESLGFVPLAFRTGTRSKQRTHIFWQKRIREGDTSARRGGFRRRPRAGRFARIGWRFPFPRACIGATRCRWCFRSLPSRSPRPT